MYIGQRNGDSLPPHHFGAELQFCAGNQQVVNLNLCARLFRLILFRFRFFRRGLLFEIVENRPDIAAAQTGLPDNFRTVNQDIPDNHRVRAQRAHLHVDAELPEFKGIIGLVAFGIADHEVVETDFPGQQIYARTIQRDRHPHHGRRALLHCRLDERPEEQHGRKQNGRKDHHKDDEYTLCRFH